MSSRDRLARDPRVDGSPWAGVAAEDFDAWGWQVRNRIDTLDELGRVLELTAEERAGFASAAGLFRFGVTPYYALLADRRDPRCPIRRQIVPRPEETQFGVGELADPLGEERLEVVPNLVHRYPDRVLLLATDRCPVYCRFCTRRRIVGRTERQATRELLAEALAYVRAHDEIREVIVSGGDALMLGDNQLAFLLGEIREIGHVDIIRIATRMPVTCPMRVTPALVEVLRRFGPVYVMTHFNHPRECTDRAAAACARLVEAGIPVHNQSVLLRGINDDAEIIGALNRRLVFMRATPYYLHQCDMAEGIEHFRTPLEVGVQIIDALRGPMSGLAVPQLCVDVPGGLGKVTVVPDWIVKREGRTTQFRTYTGAVGTYVDPAPTEPNSPATFHDTSPATFQGTSSATFQGTSSARFQGTSSARFQGTSSARFQGTSSARFQGTAAYDAVPSVQDSAIAEIAAEIQGRSAADDGGFNVDTDSAEPYGPRSLE